MKLLFFSLFLIFAIAVLRIIRRIYYMKTLSDRIAKKFYGFDDLKRQQYNTYKDKDYFDRFY